MSKIYTIRMVAALCGFAWNVSAQTAFKDASSLLGTGQFTYIAKAVADVNGDGYDDIIRIAPQPSTALNIVYQVPGFAHDSLRAVPYGPIVGFTTFGMAVADTDNDGVSEIFSGGLNDSLKITQLSTDFSAATTTILTAPPILLQSPSFFDINHDGWLDVFACADESTSVVFGNDGSGNLSWSKNALIDFSAKPATQTEGNYGSIWTDFDNDGDQDLYISKCWEPSSDPTSPTRINQLFVYSDSLGYVENAAPYGLAIGRQTWCSDFQDIDNDGDMDALIVNHAEPSQIMENDGTGHFTDITASTGLVNLGDPLQGFMRDFDNDGYVDIITAGLNGQRFFHNNGDKTFSPITGLFTTSLPLLSFAVGDLNHDGFWDVYGSYWFSQPINPPADRLWLNAANPNHYIAFRTEGVQSNRLGIGARLTLFTPAGKQIREVRAGEGYGISNSFNQIFGLGAGTKVDSVRVLWPSGLHETFIKNGIDQYHLLKEGTGKPVVSVSEGHVAAVAVPVQMYPNPATDHLSIAVAGDDRIQRIEIFNASGRQVFSNHFKDQQQAVSISLTGLLAGVYHAVVTMSSGKSRAQQFEKM